jgi:hypothetical protein
MEPAPSLQPQPPHALAATSPCAQPSGAATSLPARSPWRHRSESHAHPAAGTRNGWASRADRGAREASVSRRGGKPVRANPPPPFQSSRSVDRSASVSGASQSSGPAPADHRSLAKRLVRSGERSQREEVAAECLVLYKLPPCRAPIGATRSSASGPRSSLVSMLLLVQSGGRRLLRSSQHRPLRLRGSGSCAGYTQRTVAATRVARWEQRLG